MQKEKKIKDKKEKKIEEVTEKLEENEKTEEETVVITKEKLSEIENKLKEAEDKAMRTSAELINYRKRKDEEVSRLLQFCNEGLIMDLLPTIDNLERALMINEDSKLKEGVNMIYQMLKGILENYGLKEIESLGAMFDASVHQAVVKDNDKTKESGIITEVMQKGYTLKNKVIRPAMVKVNE